MLFQGIKGKSLLITDTYSVKFAVTSGLLIMPDKKIFLIENDESLRQMLAEQLVALDGFAVPVEGFSADLALEKVKETDFDLIIISSELSDGNGYELCRRFRAENVQIPIIILASHDENQPDTNTILQKPFRLISLIRLIKELLLKYENSQDSIIPVGHYKLHLFTKQLVDEKSGHKIRLTEKEVEILKYLHDAKGQRVDRDVLLHEVWGYNQGVTTHTLETHIYKLRQKIESDPSKAEILLTEPKGYRLSI